MQDLSKKFTLGDVREEKDCLSKCYTWITHRAKELEALRNEFSSLSGEANWKVRDFVIFNGVATAGISKGIIVISLK